MRTLVVIFLGMAFFGLLVKMYGITLIALSMCVFVRYYAHVFDKQDAERAANPQYAATPKSTERVLHEQECMHMADRL